MLCAAIEIHKHAFQAAVLDLESGEVVEGRFAADRDSLARWAERWGGRVVAVAIEATTGWRWVWRELVELGFEVRLAEPVQTRALLGRRRRAKSDRLARAGWRGCWRRRCCRSRGSWPASTRRVGREPPPRPPRQGRLAASALGARRSRGARAPRNRPRPGALPRHPRAARHHGGATDYRP